MFWCNSIWRSGSVSCSKFLFWHSKSYGDFLIHIFPSGISWVLNRNFNLSKMSTNKSIHLEVSIKCSECPYQTYQNYYLINHLKRNHGKIESKCHICDKKFRNRDFAIKHRRAIHLLLRINCDQCDNSSNTRLEADFQSW